MLLPTSASFSGREFRWGTEAQLVARRWALQGEYLEAHLRAAASHGFYVLGTYALSGANEVALSVERLNTPPPNARTTPWYIVGFDHLVSPSTSAASGGARLLDREDQATPTTLMMDVRVRTVDSVTEYQVTLQFQVFVH